MPRRIPIHRPRYQLDSGRAYETSRPRREDKLFYSSAAWIALRDLVRSEEPLCRVCKQMGFIRATEQIDHVIDRKKRPDLSLVRANLQGLCRICHNAKRRVES